MEIQEIRQMTIEDILTALKIERSQTTKHTYIYLNSDGELRAIEKRDRTAYPMDEMFYVGYVSQYMPANGRRARDTTE